MTYTLILLPIVFALGFLISRAFTWFQIKRLEKKAENLLKNFSAIQSKNSTELTTKDGKVTIILKDGVGPVNESNCMHIALECALGDDPFWKEHRKYIKEIVKNG